MNHSPPSSGRLLKPEAICPLPHTFSWQCVQLNKGITSFLPHARRQLHTSAASCPGKGTVVNRQEGGWALESMYMVLREGKFLPQLGINL